MLESPDFIRKGTASYRRMGVAVFASGFATFAALYAVQPMMSLFVSEFRLSPSSSSFVLSVSSLTLAAAMLAVGVFADGWKRQTLMRLSLLLTTGLTFISAWSPDYASLLVVRAVLGVALAGVPSVIMAYVGEETDPASLGTLVGLCISGNVIGGMTGRMLGDTLSEWLHWRTALVLIGCISLLASLLFWRMLPPAANFHKRQVSVGAAVAAFGERLMDRQLIGLYLIGGILMGAFTVIYNYTAFRLLEPPFSFSHAGESVMFLPYVLGAFSSYWMGRLSDRLGHARMLTANLVLMLAGIAVSIPDGEVAVFTGITLCTLGFFGGHSVASGWVNRRSAVGKAQSASLYLFGYYVGSGIFGTVGGAVWTRYRWEGIAALVALLLLAGLFITRMVARHSKASL